MEWHVSKANGIQVMDVFTNNNKLHYTYAYLENLILCGRDEDEHDTNLSSFLML